MLLDSHPQLLVTAKPRFQVRIAPILRFWTSPIRTSLYFRGCFRIGGDSLPIAVQPCIACRIAVSANFRSMSMIAKAVLADIVGITAVALASGAVAAALYRSQAISQPWLVWLIALPFLVGASLWVWHISEKTRNWKS